MTEWEHYCRCRGLLHWWLGGTKVIGTLLQRDCLQGMAKSPGEVARRVEHVGSTAVPGLAAKPFVDIVVAVDDPDDESGHLAAMEGRATNCASGMPGTACFELLSVTSTFMSGRPDRTTTADTWCSGTGCAKPLVNAHFKRASSAGSSVRSSRT